MDSCDLTQFGFIAWQAIDATNEKALLVTLPEKFGVYVIRRVQPIGRFQGESDIAYIGKATNAGGLRRRIYQYFHPGPTQTTNQRILAMIAHSNAFQLSNVICETAEEATALEHRLLSQYDSDHLELPPLNRQG